MKHTMLAVAAAALLSTGALAQSKGEADYKEHCSREASKASPAEQKATRESCIEDARKAARTYSGSDQPGTTASRGATREERTAAREKRRAEGREAARHPKQDPKRPDQL